MKPLPWYLSGLLTTGLAIGSHGWAAWAWVAATALCVGVGERCDARNRQAV